MSRRSVSFALAMVLVPMVSASALASDLPPRLNLPGTPYCGDSYRYDSYGRGLEAGIRGGDLRPKLLDEECYELGMADAKKDLVDPNASSDPDSCVSDFDSGYAEGRVFSLYAAGSACYNAGYRAGEAAVDVGAREGNVSAVGQACVDAYQQGGSDARANRVEESPSMLQPVLSCYSLGYYDATLFR